MYVHFGGNIEIFTMKNVNGYRYKFPYKFIYNVFPSVWQRTLEANKKKLASPKMINGSGREGEGGEGSVFVDTFTDFTVNRIAFNDGYVLLRNAIVRECLLRCHGRMSAVVGRILPNGITTGTIMAQSTRRWCGLAKEEDASVLGAHDGLRENTGTKIYASYSIH